MRALNRWINQMEFKLLTFFLKQHVKKMDQFDLYRFKDQYSTVYIEIKREATPGAQDSAYVEI